MPLPPPLPPLPPHAGTDSNISNVKNISKPRVLWSFPPRNTPDRTSPRLNIHKAAKYLCGWEWFIAVVAVVVMVMATLVVFGVPLAATEVGLKMHCASEGNPEQASEIVPLKPVELEMLTELDPDPPGAEICTVD